MNRMKAHEAKKLADEQSDSLKRSRIEFALNAIKSASPSVLSKFRNRSFLILEIRHTWSQFSYKYAK